MAAHGSWFAKMDALAGILNSMTPFKRCLTPNRITLTSTKKMNNAAISLSCFCAIFGFSPTKQFGPMWNDPKYVMECLYRYAKEEGHNTASRTVAEFALRLAEDQYAATGEEINAIIRLYQLGLENEVISL